MAISLFDPRQDYNSRAKCYSCQYTVLPTDFQSPISPCPLELWLTKSIANTTIERTLLSTIYTQLSGTTKRSLHAAYAGAVERTIAA
jgi:hypothetical protein